MIGVIITIKKGSKLSANEKVRFNKTLLEGTVKKLQRLYQKLEESDKKLNKEKEKAQNYLDIAGVIIVALDSKGTVTLINKKGCEIIDGKGKNCILGKNWFDNALPKKNKNVVKGVFRELMNGKSEHVEYVENALITKKGEERIIGWHNTLLTDENGKIIGTLSSGTDITDRITAEEELQKNQNKYQRVIGTVNEGIMIVNDKNRIIYTNSLMADILGYTEIEIIGKSLFSFMDKSGKNICEQNLKKRKQGLKEEPYFELIHRDGRKVYTAMETSPINDELGNYTGGIIAVTDLTKQKKLEDELETKNETIKAMLAFSKNPVTFTNLQGNITDCNQATLDWHGFRSKDEIIGMNSLELVAKKDHERAIRNSKKTVKEERVNHIKYTLVRKDGSEFEALLSASVIRDSKGKPVAFIGLTEKADKQELEL